MAISTSKTLRKHGQLSSARARSVAESLQKKAGAKKSATKITITHAKTATGAGKVSFHASKVVRRLSDGTIVVRAAKARPGAVRTKALAGGALSQSPGKRARKSKKK